MAVVFDEVLGQEPVGVLGADKVVDLLPVEFDIGATPILEMRGHSCSSGESTFAPRASNVRSNMNARTKVLLDVVGATELPRTWAAPEVVVNFVLSLVLFIMEQVVTLITLEVWATVACCFAVLVAGKPARRECAVAITTFEVIVPRGH